MPDATSDSSALRRDLFRERAGTLGAGAWEFLPRRRQSSEGVPQGPPRRHDGCSLSFIRRSGRVRRAMMTEVKESSDGCRCPVMFQSPSVVISRWRSCGNLFQSPPSVPPPPDPSGRRSHAG